jgi:hypothetical protein
VNEVHDGINTAVDPITGRQIGMIAAPGAANAAGKMTLVNKAAAVAIYLDRGRVVIIGD